MPRLTTPALIRQTKWMMAAQQADEALPEGQRRTQNQLVQQATRLDEEGRLNDEGIDTGAAGR